MSAAGRAGSKAGKLASFAVGVLAPVSIALVVGAVLVSERSGPDTELQLVAPADARPGDRLALRANLLHRVDEPDGPTLTTGSVVVTLVDAVDPSLPDPPQHIHAQTRLAISPAKSMEGAIVVPATLRYGHYTLIARSRSASVRAALIVRDDAPGADPAPREVAPLARLALGPLVVVAGDPPPGPAPAMPPGPVPAVPPGPAPVVPPGPVLGAVPPAELPTHSDVRVVGGTCIPELPCTLLVHVGVPPADVALAATPSVEPVVQRRAPLTESDIVSLIATVHGPEGETALILSRGERELARRSLRLPVALGEAQLETSPFALLGSTPSVRVLGAARNRAVIIDVFASGHWVYTHAFRAGALDTPRALPGFRFERQVPYHIQARTDLFDSSAAASRYVHIARDVNEPPPIDPIMSPYAERQERGRERRTAAFYFASLDPERLATPTPVSGRDAAIARALAARDRVRVISVVALVVLSSLLVLMILLRGLRASREARALLLEAGDANADSASHRRRDTVAVLAIVAAILLAFLATLAFVLARLAANVG